MTTKYILFVIGITILINQAYSQKSNDFRAYVGYADSELYRKPMDGGAGFQVENLNEFGVKYLRLIKGSLYLETGINYSTSHVKIIPEFMGTPVESRDEQLEIISIPLYVNYTFWKYLFISGGLIFDIQKSDNSIHSQSGIGYSLGLGGKYEFHNFLFFINPNYKRHSFISFEKGNNRQKLTEAGVQLGIGYIF